MAARVFNPLAIRLSFPIAQLKRVAEKKIYLHLDFGFARFFRIELLLRLLSYAGVAKLADALDLGSSA